jgi:hypothetical protein
MQHRSQIANPPKADSSWHSLNSPAAACSSNAEANPAGLSRRLVLAVAHLLALPNSPAYADVAVQSRPAFSVAEQQLIDLYERATPATVNVIDITLYVSLCLSFEGPCSWPSWLRH